MSVFIGVNSEGLFITVFPMRSAGIMCQIAIINGQFQGVIDPTTPIALRRPSMRLFGESSYTSTGISMLVECRVHAIAPPTSI